MPSRSVRIPEDKFIEHIYPYMGQYLAVEKRIARAATGRQEIELVWNRHLGGIFIIDGIIQHTDLDEYIYAELFAHVPLACISSREPRVLIIGGGDMGVMEEVLKHGGVRQCDLVDMDAGVIDFARRYMRHIHNDCWRDPRAAVAISDGLDFLRQTTNVYDAILVDGTDPGYPEMGNSLFTDDFFELARAHVSDGGMFVIGSDVPFHHPQAVAPIQRRLARLYANAGAFHGTVPTFQGGVTLFAYGINQNAPLSPLPDRLPPGLRYLNAATLGACFALPEYIRRLVELEDIPGYEWRGHE
jgi:spermidine synthase